MNKINHKNLYETCVGFLYFWKIVTKRPTTQTAIADLRRSYVIEIFRIVTTIKVYDIQQLSIWLIHPGNQVNLKVLYITVCNQLIVYALFADPKIEQFLVPTRFLVRGFCCDFFLHDAFRVGVSVPLINPKDEGTKTIWLQKKKNSRKNMSPV